MAWSVIWQHRVFAVLLKKNKPMWAQTNMAVELLLFFFAQYFQFLGLPGNEKRGRCCGLDGCLNNNFMQIPDEGPLNPIKMPWKCEAVAETNAISPPLGKAIIMDNGRYIEEISCADWLNPR